MDAEQLVTWLRAAGYHPGQQAAPLTRSSVAKFLKADNRAFWEALVQRLPTKRDSTDVDSQQGAPNAQKEGSQRAALEEQLARNARLQALVTMQEERIATRTSEVMANEAQLAQLQQQLEASQMQLLVWKSAQGRHAKLLPILQQHLQQFQHLVRLARERAAHTDSKGPEAVLLGQLVSRLQQGLADHTDLWMARQTACVRTADILPLNSLAPPTLLALLTKMLQQGLETLQRVRTDPEPGSQQAQPLHRTDSSALPPSALIQQQQQAHVSKFVLTEQHLNQQEEVRAELEHMRTAARPLMQWPYNQHKLQEASLTAEVATLREEMSRLRREHAARQATEQRVHELWRRCEGLALKETQLYRLVQQLFRDRIAIVSRWEGEGKEHQAWVQQHLPEACRSLRSHASGGQDVLARECDSAAHAQQQHSQPYELVPPQAYPSTGASTPRSFGQGSNGGPGSSATETTPTLQLIHTCLPSVGALLAKQQAGGMGATGGTPARSRGLLPAGGQMVAALKAACALDALAPMRCPGSLLQTVSDHMAHLRTCRMWVDATKPCLDANQQRIRDQAARQQQVQQQVAKARSTDRDQRQGQLRQWVNDIHQDLRYIEESTRPCLEDFKTRPAVTLLPDVQYAGLNALEWLTAVQELHTSIAEAEALAGSRQMTTMMQEAGNKGAWPVKAVWP